MISRTLTSRKNSQTLAWAHSKMDLSHYLFLLFWFLKPFYIWESGIMQISDFVFAAAFIAWFIINRGTIRLNRDTIYLALFIASTFIINAVYTYILRDTSYLLSSIYYTYNFFVVIVFSDIKRNKTFLKCLLWISLLNLLMQLAMLVLGLGEYFWGVHRFMGSFNDPNQFSFSMFTSFLIIYLLAQYLYNQELRSMGLISLFAFLLSFYFVVQGSSTGMLLGFVVFTGMLMLSVVQLDKTPAFVFLKFAFIVLIVSAILAVAFLGFSGVDMDASPDSASFLFTRLVQKLTKFENGGIVALFKDRGMDKLLTYPQYLIYGSGEGSFVTRFIESKHEVHSTFPGILFYYGLIPFSFLCLWIWHQLKHIHLLIVPVYLALFMESLTLANQRQPAFWIIIILGSLTYIDRSNERRIKLTRSI